MLTKEQLNDTKIWFGDDTDLRERIFNRLKEIGIDTSSWKSSGNDYFKFYMIIDNSLLIKSSNSLEQIDLFLADTKKRIEPSDLFEKFVEGEYYHIKKNTVIGYDLIIKYKSCSSLDDEISNGPFINATSKVFINSENNCIRLDGDARLATPQERSWLNVCIACNRYIPIDQMAITSDAFKVGDWVIITDNGFGTSHEDIGMVCKIISTDYGDRTDHWFMYPIEIDRDKSGNNNRFLSEGGIRKALPSEIPTINQTDFKKGDYVVLLASCNGGNCWTSMPVNHVYKLRLDSSIGCFMVEKDKNNKENGWSCSYGNNNKLIRLRQASGHEALLYQMEGRPVSVMTQAVSVGTVYIDSNASPTFAYYSSGRGTGILSKSVIIDQLNFININTNEKDNNTEIVPRKNFNFPSGEGKSTTPKPVRQYNFPR